MSKSKDKSEKSLKEIGKILTLGDSQEKLKNSKT